MQVKDDYNAEFSAHSAEPRQLEQAQLQNIIDLAKSLSLQNEMSEISRIIGEKISRLLNAEVVLILLLNPATQQTVKTVHKVGPDASARYHALQNQISGWILHNNQALLSADFHTDNRFSKMIVKDIPVQSVLGIPLRIEGMLIGSIILLKKSKEKSFTELDLIYLETIGIISAPYLRNVQQLQNYVKVALNEATLLGKYHKLGLLGKSKSFLTLLQAIEAAAPCDVRVLLEGQTGTGKELIARAIHSCSPRSSGPFVAVDCGAIPVHLLESELFGHIKGAFTGAQNERKGLIEEANHGTLFMDEVTNLPLDMQAKLLRMLQEGEIRPVGSNKSRKVDVRVISAASASLQEKIDRQQFREDLFYRLYVYPISVPSLNERREDIPVLAGHFLKKYAAQQNKSLTCFSRDILHLMTQHTWAGNIRELENLVRRLVTLAPPETTLLTLSALPSNVREQLSKMDRTFADSLDDKSIQEKMADLEAELVCSSLQEHHWNQSAAARKLKISVQALRYKMEKLGIRK